MALAPAQPRPLCAVCILPMDPALAAAGFFSHPCCDPHEPWCPVCRAGPARCDPARHPQRAGKCGGCGHAAHRDQCPRKGPSRCVPLLDPAAGAQAGVACGDRGPCPCPWGWCHTCRAPVVGAATLPLGSGAPEIDIDRGSAGAPDGQWAVRKLPDGTLAARRLAAGEDPGPGEWRGREHAHQLTAKEAIRG